MITAELCAVSRKIDGFMKFHLTSAKFRCFIFSIWPVLLPYKDNRSTPGYFLVSKLKGVGVKFCKTPWTLTEHYWGATLGGAPHHAFFHSAVKQKKPTFSKGSAVRTLYLGKSSVSFRTPCGPDTANSASGYYPPPPTIIHTYIRSGHWLNSILKTFQNQGSV